MRAEDFLGRRVAGYRIEAVIGTGTMTVVYRALDMRRDQKVALKILFPLPGDDEVRTRFLREVAVAQRLDHPGIVPVLNVGEVERQPFLVMPLIDGGNAGRTIAGCWPA